MCVCLWGGMCTGEAGRPGYVQVEVLGGVNEHVQVPVGLRKEHKTTHSSFIGAHTHTHTRPRGCCYYPPTHTPKPPKPKTHTALQTSAN